MITWSKAGCKLSEEVANIVRSSISPPCLQCSMQWSEKQTWIRGYLQKKYSFTIFCNKNNENYSDKTREVVHLYIYIYIYSRKHKRGLNMVCMCTILFAILYIYFRCRYSFDFAFERHKDLGMTTCDVTQKHAYWLIMIWYTVTWPVTCIIP